MPKPATAPRAITALAFALSVFSSVAGARDALPPPAVTRAMSEFGVPAEHVSIHVRDATARLQCDVASPQRSHALEEIAEVNPPRRGGHVAAPAHGEAPVGVHRTAAIEPVRGNLPLRVRDQCAERIERQVRDVALRVDGDVAAAAAVLGYPLVLQRPEASLLAFLNAL